ncbi:Uncharacterised protein [Klebsiella variicola]|nr:Uncharacterised protein [Klebsiella variicola]
MCFYLPLDITYLLAQKLRHTPAGTDNICRCVCRQVFFQPVLLTQGITQQNIPPSQECTEISDFGCRRLPAVWLLKECVTGQHIRIFLYSKFGIRSFVDSEVWGYMDDALRELNNNHNKFPGQENTYIYERCNKLASNLNMILSSALIKMIHESECLIFINTIDSCIRDGNEFRTKSPWIFTELLMSSMLEKRAHKDRPLELRKSLDESRAVAANESFDQALFSYPLYLKHMHNVTNDKINRINEIKPYGLYSTTTVHRDTVYHFKVDDVFKNLDSIYKLVIYR